MIRTIWAVFIAFIATFFFSVAAVITGIFQPYSKITNGIIRSWAKVILWASGIRVQVEGREYIDPRQYYIYMPNHQSAFDILACVVAIPGTVRFIAKKELFRIPVFAHGMRAVGMIAIDRGNSAKARETLSQALEKMRRGVSVIIYPEGTRSRDGNIQKFKKGGFIMAIQGQIPIIPVVISGSFEIFKRKSLWLINKNRSIKVRFLPPVDPAPYTLRQRNELVNLVHSQIVSHFNDERKSHGI